jgi:NAD(P)-dependent dehydrogenase (short-subunit alcohol dehydrogenase family)
MEGKVALVTGASSGIGEAVALELAERGARVVPVGRDAGRLAKVAKRIERAGGGAAEPLRADFASLAEVRGLASGVLERHERIDVLVNNAGLTAGRRELTEDGHELTFAVNHLAPFLLTNLLLPRLRACAPARVVTTSSDAHRSGRLDFDDLQREHGWASWRAYSDSKLANVLFTRALARRLEGSAVDANAVHPGVIRTRLGRGASPLLRLGWTAVKPFLGSPRRGADTIAWLAGSPEAEGLSGLYFSDGHPAPLRGQAADDDAAERLWKVSEGLTGL